MDRQAWSAHQPIPRMDRSAHRLVPAHRPVPRIDRSQHRLVPEWKTGMCGHRPVPARSVLLVFLLVCLSVRFRGFSHAPCPGRVLLSPSLIHRAFFPAPSTSSLRARRQVPHPDPCFCVFVRVCVCNTRSEPPGSRWTQRSSEPPPVPPVCCSAAARPPLPTWPSPQRALARSTQHQLCGGCHWHRRSRRFGQTLHPPPRSRRRFCEASPYSVRRPD